MNEIDVKIKARIERAVNILGLKVSSNVLDQEKIEATKLVFEVVKMIEREEAGGLDGI